MTDTQTISSAGRELADGRWMPMLGLGVWQADDARECTAAVRWAIQAGYRHIDTAQAYGNEQAVGEGIRTSGIARDELFITTKFLPRLADPVAALEGSLNRLSVDQVDLYLVHWPEGGPLAAWRGMERAFEQGYARSIGVSNFGVDDLKRVLAAAQLAPVVNQVNFNPFAYRQALLASCIDNGVALEAYSPLGTGSHINDPTVVDVARRHERTPAQVLLRWCMQHGAPVLPKSVHRARIEENARLFDFSLAAEDMSVLDALDRTAGSARALEGVWWAT